MDFKKQIEAFRASCKARITAESTPEEVEAINADIAKYDELEKDHDELVAQVASLKDTIVRVVSTQGSGDKPKDDVDGSNPKTIEEIIAEKQANGGK